MKPRNWTAKDVMKRKVLSVSPDIFVRELAGILDDRGISGAPVVDGNGTLLGVVSKSDLVHFQREGEHDRDRFAYFKQVQVLPEGYHVEIPDRTRVREIMTPSIIQAGERTPVALLARMMRRKRIHRIFITRGQTLRGVVTTMDLLKIIEAAAERAR